MQKEMRESGEQAYASVRAADLAILCKAVVWTPTMLSALERGVRGGKWYALIDKVYNEKNLEVSYERVKKNAGAPGVDRMTVEEYGRNLEEELERLQEQLKSKRYEPEPIKRCYIPKPGSATKRPLGIPTVRDRVVQGAVRQVIEPIFEYEFSDCSYGFRPGRGCKDALRRVAQGLADGYVHVVDADIENFFGNLDHELLMERIELRVADGRVLELIKQFLKQGVLEEGEISEPQKGTPQGGVISPLLANIYLDELDKKLEDECLVVRYADDVVLMCKSAEEANKMLQALEAVVSDLRLTLHPTKTKIVSMTQPKERFTFLGYDFVVGRQSKIRRYPSMKSSKKLRQKLKMLTRRNSGKAIAATVKTLNAILKGWYEYFKHSSARGLKPMDGWVRRRLRAILDRNNKKRHSMGYGRAHQRYPNKYFINLGLYTMDAQQAADIQSAMR